jgi:hypothetical protein
VFRWLQVHDDVAGRPGLIRALATRPLGTAVAAFQLTVNGWCSTAITTAATPAASFASNHGPNKMQVISSRLYNFPAQSPGRLPPDFPYDLVFDTPFPFPATGPLCWEIEVTGNTPASGAAHSFVPAAGYATASLRSSSYGTGCRVSTQSSPMAAASGPSGVSVTGTFGPANSFVIVALGFNDRVAFGSVPLPFAIPTTGSAASGLCQLYTDLPVVTATATNATGGSSTTFPFPMTPDLNGISTFTQLLAFDAAANPIGVQSSNVVCHNFMAPSGPPPAAYVYVIGTALTGNASRGGIVTRFTY